MNRAVSQIPSESPRLQSPRMRDIAKEAGVSLGTVSRVLSGNTEVAPELAERVILAARRIGYEPKPVKRPTAPDGSELGAIGYLVDGQSFSRGSLDAFQQNFLSGVQQAASQRGGHVVFACSESDIKNGTVPSIIAERVVRAVIVKISERTPESWLKMIQAQVPIVQLMWQASDRSIPSVVCDNFEGMYKALDYLGKLGHTRVGFYREDDGEYTSHDHLEREAAYRKLVPHFGFAEGEEYIQTPTRNLSRNETFEDVVHKGMRHFLALKEARPTAIVCAADIYAFAIMKMAGGYGISIPEDLSLIGFMNTQPCDFSNPPLTSVSLSEMEIGRSAVDLLQRRLENSGSVLQHMVIGTHLVTRSSCAASPSISSGT